ncbi:MAG: hypothetical protein M1832_001356 [Thelocarpon impressellum]|nr:MAG: hypothetical protein M1832_001356 [Thelocarpon impressellum]
MPARASSTRPERRFAILAVAAYPRNDFSRSVIQAGQQAPSSLRPGHEPPPPPSAAPGLLDCLPLEIVHMVYRQLDLASLMSVRRSNRRSMQTVNALVPYSSLAEHAMGALAAIFKTGVASRAAVAHLYALLLTENCSVCGRFGGFICLAALSRCCFPCIEGASQLRIISRQRAVACFGIDGRRLKSAVPVVRTLPGTYSWERRSRLRRVLLVSAAEAEDAANRLRLAKDGPDHPPLPPDQRPDDPLHRLMAATSMPFLDPSTREVQQGVSCKGCQAALEDSVLSPAETRPAYERRNILYSQEGFLAHFRECSPAQRMWDESRGGTAPFKEPMWTRLGDRL